MEKIAYIGDQPSKKWNSPITRKTYNFVKQGGAQCPISDVDDKDVEKALSHSNTFDLYSRITNNKNYFKDLAKRRAKRTAERIKKEKAEIEAQKSAEVGQVENIVGEMLEPLLTAISNLSHDVESLQNDNKLIKAGIAELQPKK